MVRGYHQSVVHVTGNCIDAATIPREAGVGACGDSMHVDDVLEVARPREGAVADVLPLLRSSSRVAELVSASSTTIVGSTTWVIGCHMTTHH